MAATVTLVTSGGLAVSEAPDGFGTPVTPIDDTAPVTITSVPVTLVTNGGLPVTFISVDGVLWPGGVAP